MAKWPWVASLLSRNRPPKAHSCRSFHRQCGGSRKAQFSPRRSLGDTPPRPKSKVIPPSCSTSPAPIPNPFEAFVKNLDDSTAPEIRPERPKPKFPPRESRIDIPSWRESLELENAPVDGWPCNESEVGGLAMTEPSNLTIDRTAGPIRNWSSTIFTEIPNPPDDNADLSLLTPWKDPSRLKPTSSSLQCELHRSNSVFLYFPLPVFRRSVPWPHHQEHFDKQQVCSNTTTLGDCQHNRPYPYPSSRTSSYPFSISSGPSILLDDTDIDSSTTTIASCATKSLNPAMDLTEEVIKLRTAPIAFGGYSTIRLGVWRPGNGSKGMGDGGRGRYYYGPMEAVIKSLNGQVFVSNDENPDAESVTQGHKVLRNLFSEIRIWQSLNHPNIVRLCGYIWEDSPHLNSEIAGGGISVRALGLISPYYRHGTVKRYLKYNKMANRMSLCEDVAAGLAYLHLFTPQVVHGDLKGDNILINDDQRASICDFGLSMLLDDQSPSATAAMTSSVPSPSFGGTIRYLAPELLDDVERSASSDVYAFGCTCLEILYDLEPYPHIRSDGAVLDAIHRGALPFDFMNRLAPTSTSKVEAPFCDPNSLVPPLVAEILTSCWNFEPGKRPSALELREKLGNIGIGGSK